MKQLLISAGPVHMRAVLLHGDHPAAFRAAPFDAVLFPGDRAEVRVLGHPASLDGAVVASPAGEGVLTRPKAETPRAFAARLPEGATIWAEMKSSARIGHGARWVEAEERGGNAGWLGCLAHTIGLVDAVVIDSAAHLALARQLWSCLVEHHTAIRPILADYETEYRTALNPVRTLSGGGAVRWQPTAAFHAFDVDAGGQGRDATNAQAAHLIADMVTELGLEGLMVAGFIPSAKRDGPHQILKDRLGGNMGRMDHLGVMSFALPRLGMALDEVVFESDPAGFCLRRRTGDVVAEACAVLAVERATSPAPRWQMVLHPDCVARAEALRLASVTVHSDLALPREGFQVKQSA